MKFKLPYIHYTERILKESDQTVYHSVYRTIDNPHHGPAVSSFLVSNGSTNGAGCFRGLVRLIKSILKIFLGVVSEIGTLGTLTGPHGTKKKILKNFLMESY